MKKVILLLLTSLMVFWPTSVLAQTAATDSSLIATPINSALDFEAEITKVTTQYRSEFQDYRRLHDAYQISKQQYVQLDTLVALEKAVRDTQAVMRARAQALKTYLALMRLMLLNQTGVNLDEKQATETDLLAASELIETHLAKLEPELDKPAIDQLALEFEELLPQLEDAAYRAKTLISIGKLQTLYDKSQTLRDDFESTLNEGGALRLAERQRSFDEIKRTLDSLEPEFDEAEKKVSEREYSSYESIHRQVSDRMTEVYNDLSRVVSFLREALTL